MFFKWNSFWKGWGVEIVSFAAVLWDVTQRSPPKKTAAKETRVERQKCIFVTLVIKLLFRSYTSLHSMERTSIHLVFFASLQSTQISEDKWTFIKTKLQEKICFAFPNSSQLSRFKFIGCWLVEIIKSIHLIGSFCFERRPVWIRMQRARLLN